MKNIFTIVKKEFARFFKDRRMVITVFLPGILIYIMYSLMGNVFGNMNKIDDNYKPTVAVFNAPTNEIVSSALKTKFSVVISSETEAIDKINSGSLDIVVFFPTNFDEAISGEINTPPEVKIYYNSEHNTSTYAYSMLSGVLELVNTHTFSFSINSSEDKFDLAKEQNFAVQMISTLVPMLMFSLLASGCMAVAPESIAGEKERGTMSTILITPIKRSELALGKIVSLTCFALLSGISSFLGVILSLPKLSGGLISGNMVATYSVLDYLMIFGIIISVVLVIISAFAVLSAFAKSVKEAGSIITPLMIVIILLGMGAMFFSGSTSVWLHLIPLLGSALAMSSIMSLTASGLGVALSIISNLVVSFLLILLLTKMFKSERIMFNK